VTPRNPSRPGRGTVLLVETDLGAGTMLLPARDRPPAQTVSTVRSAARFKIETLPSRYLRQSHQAVKVTGAVRAGRSAGDLMTHPAVTVSPEDPVEVAARLMYTLQVKRLPVIDPSGRLAGIISRADVLAVFDRSDEEIRKEVADDVICQEFGAAPRQFAVTVQAGVVTLEGNAETAALGHVIVRKVRHVQGVVAVRDRLTYPDVYASVAGPGF
jgi:CBS domain-containing protein